MLVITVLLVVLTFGTQAVLSSSSFKFSLANIEQCGPVAVSFSGNRPLADDLPLTLTLLPFNSTPISVPIPMPALTSPTVWVTTLPIQEGTIFIASLDDVTGVPLGFSSDVLKVQPSPTGNSTCLQSVEPSPRRFSISGPISQCQPFDVTYNTTLVGSPSIRAFRPRHSSFAINETGASTDGTNTYLMSATRQTETVLLFDDGFGYRELSDLLLVGGDSSSDNTCVRARLANSSLMEMDQQSKAGPSRSVVIGISTVVGVVVGGLAILMIMHISNEQRRRRELRLSEFVNLQTTRQRLSSNILSIDAGRYVTASPYASEKAPSAPASQFASYAGDSARSIMNATPFQSRSDSLPGSIRQNVREKAAESIAGSADSQSLSSLDIEHILDMATIYPEAPLHPPPVATQFPTLPTASPFLRHLRNPSDVPSDLSPHQSFSAVFPSRSSYPASQRLTATSQSGLSYYSSSSAGQTRGTGLPTSFLPLPPRASERVSSFPVSVTSSLPPGDMV